MLRNLNIKVGGIICGPPSTLTRTGVIGLRNLNQNIPLSGILGTPSIGVVGSLIPSSGPNGPSMLYSQLSLPSDAGSEVRGIVGWIPAGVTSMFVAENGSFYATAPNGTYWFPVNLLSEGVFVGQFIVTMIFGAGHGSNVGAADERYRILLMGDNDLMNVLTAFVVANQTEH